jgi:hypothetical protein
MALGDRLGSRRVLGERAAPQQLGEVVSVGGGLGDGCIFPKGRLRWPAWL